MRPDVRQLTADSPKTPRRLAKEFALTRQKICADSPKIPRRVAKESALTRVCRALSPGRQFCGGRPQLSVLGPDSAVAAQDSMDEVPADSVTLHVETGRGGWREAPRTRHLDAEPGGPPSAARRLRRQLAGSRHRAARGSSAAADLALFCWRRPHSSLAARR